MKIKRLEQKEDGPRLERRIVTGMIVSESYLRAVLPIFNDVWLEIPFARRVACWCREHFEQYKKAPGRHIEDIYHTHKDQMPPDEAEAVEKFLQSLAAEWEHAPKFNTEYLMDATVEYFKRKSLTALASDIRGDLSAGKAEDAENRLAQYKRVAVSESDGVDPYTDAELIYDAFEDSATPLFTLPGALGRMVNPELVREGFIGILGKEKVGKSFWAIELAHMARKAHCNVALFATGDMSKKQMTRRFAIRATGKTDRPWLCGRFLLPVLDCRKNQRGECQKAPRPGQAVEPITKDWDGNLEKRINKYAEHVPCSVCAKEKPHKFRGDVWWEWREQAEPLTWREAYKAARKFAERSGRGFKLVCKPTGTLTPRAIVDQLDRWERFDGWVPDVIIVDYVDIMAPDDTRLDKRNQENSKWMALRAISLERHCLVIAPTQGDSDAMEAFTLKLENFSEDKRKYAHVTAFFSLNQVAFEKKQGRMRWGVLLLREGDYDSAKLVTVLQGLRLGRTYIASY